MEAVVLTAYGDVDKLEVEDQLDPRAGPGEIKVRMAGAGINPVDWKLRSGVLQTVMPLVLPAILGRDASGEVVEVGPGVTRFKVGARVMGLVVGAYAEFVVAATDAWTEVPAKMDLVDAAALPLVLLTGAQLIEEAVRPHEGDVVLVTGAVGGVGRAALFTAKARGAKVWAGVRGAQKAEAAKLGADGVVALDDDAEIDSLPPLDCLADTIGGPTIAKLLGAMKSGGIVGTVVGKPAGATDRGLVVRGMMTHPDAGRLAVFAQAVADGKLVIPIAKRFPLTRAREAQTFAEHHSGGKVLLTGSLHSGSLGAAHSKPRDSRTGGSRTTGVSPSPNIEHILVPHDFSETTEAALAFAITIAAKFNARVTLLHAYERPSYAYPDSLVEDSEFETEVHRAAHKALEGVAARIRTAAIPIAVLLRQGTPWVEIVAAAEQTKADLIVMGTHGRRGVSRALLGSVAEKVVRTAPCPVLTVRASPALETPPKSS